MTVWNRPSFSLQGVFDTNNFVRLATGGINFGPVFEVTTLSYHECNRLPYKSRNTPFRR